jgi:hypothetical protein
MRTTHGTRQAGECTPRPSTSPIRQPPAHAHTHLDTLLAVGAHWAQRLGGAKGRGDTLRVVSGSNGQRGGRPLGAVHGVVAAGPALVGVGARGAVVARGAGPIACNRKEKEGTPKGKIGACIQRLAQQVE